MSLTKSNKLLTAALLLTIGVNANSFAQQVAETEGIARITDGRTKAVKGPTGPASIQPISSRQVAAPDTATPLGTRPSVYDGPGTSCPNGNCDMGWGCDQGNCPHCRGRGCHFREHYCKHSPDFGYSPPAHYPLHRRGVEYNAYYPAKWYGAGGDYIHSTAPMVYMPTDTTQLGFYYQHVPTWQPRPNFVPERPIPAQWHTTPPPVHASNFCNGSCYGQGGYGLGHGWGGHGLGGPGWGSQGCEGDGNCWNARSGFPRRTLFGSGRNHGYSGTEWCPSACCSMPPCTATTPNSAPSVLPEGATSGTVVPPYGSAPTVDPVPPNNPSAMIPPSPVKAPVTSELPPLMVTAQAPAVNKQPILSTPGQTPSTVSTQTPEAAKNSNVQPIGFINKRI